jgi:PAS domain S-box-containing protein
MPDKIITSKSNSREHEYLMLLDTINTHVFYLADPATYGMVNRAHAEFFGLKKTDLEYKNLYDVLDKAEADVCVEANQKIFTDKKQIVTEELLQGADGRERLFAFTKTPHFNEAGEVAHVVCTGEDITETKQAKDELEANKHFLDNIINSIQDGISVLDKEYTVVHTNSVMRQWYKNSGELIGKKCYHVYHNKDKLCEDCPTRKVLSSGSAHSEIIPGLPGSGVEWLELYSFPLRDHKTGEITGVVEFVRDISDRRHMEKQLIHAQKMEAVGTLSSGIAHDFNNILQTILGSIQLLSLPKSDEHPDQKHLKIIEKTVNGAKELTSRLLFFNREIASNLQPVNLNKELPGLVKLLERTLPKMIRIEQLYGKDLKTVMVDTVQIEQIILNLAINASHAMPDGGQLTLKTENVSVDSAHASSNQDLHEGEYVTLTVSDTGTGMDPETLSRIYEPFYTTKPSKKGSGLGLSMVYGIVKNHEGVIACSSIPGTGTTFKLYFPTIAGREAVPNPTMSEAMPESGNEVILVVDDEDYILDIACEILDHFGYQTLRAQSGEEALERLKQSDIPINLVLLDLNMPGMGGHKCLLQIHDLEAPPKVIIASGYAADGNTQVMLDSGACAFLQKPYQLLDLAKTIRRCLNDDQTLGHPAKL